MVLLFLPFAFKIMLDIAFRIERKSLYPSRWIRFSWSECLRFSNERNHQKLSYILLTLQLWMVYLCSLFLYPREPCYWDCISTETSREIKYNSFSISLFLAGILQIPLPRCTLQDLYFYTSKFSDNFIQEGIGSWSLNQTINASLYF